MIRCSYQDSAMKIQRRAKRYRKPTLVLTAALLLGAAGCHQNSAAGPVEGPSENNAAADTTVPQVAGLPQAALAAAQGIDPEQIRASVKELADDKYQGRYPGTPGGDAAAKYIADQLQAYGIKPAGDDGSYFQKVPFYAVHTVADKTQFSLVPKSGSPIELKYADEYVTNNQTGAADSTIDAPIVFVGHGIDAPEYQWDDFKGVDVKGKVLLVVVNEPASDDPNFFKGKALTYYGRWTYKYEEAARKGAVGVLIIHRTDLASYPWTVVKSSWSGEHSYLKGDPLAKLKAASWIQLDTARKLFAAAGLDVNKEITASDQRGFKAVELPVKLKAHIVSQRRDFDSSNVVGVVDGSSGAKSEAVLYTAHYDHLGIDPNIKTGDNIYNGAADNGTGCGILLALANAYATAAKNGAQPLHNVYFSGVTAEEQGLLGSEYLGMHPPVPAKDISLDLNYDMLLPIGIPTSANVSGAERTTFYPTVEATAKAFKLVLQPDQNPNAGHYYRSDHFSLARVGIPAFSIGEGTLFAGHPDSWGKEQEEEYTAKRYHQVTDEYKPDMDFRGDARMAQFGFVLGWEASSAAAPVEWQSGDEFEKARKKSESSTGTLR
jgi:Zn-dependent M28 family amino/carboxypeptidase